MNVLPLRHRNFGLLWAAGLISDIGDWVLRIALPLFVLRIAAASHNATAAVSAVVLAGLLASLAFGTIAGACVDRWDRRRVLVLVNALQALALAPLLAVRSADRVWIAVAVAFVEAALAQFVVPAVNALAPRLVPADRLAAANALSSLSHSVGRLIGPAAGGLVAATLGLGAATLLDAGSFVVAAAGCALIRGAHRADPQGVRPAVHHELVAGLRTIAGNRIARAILTFFTLTAVGEGMMSTLFVVFVTRTLHAGGREMGWMLSAQAIGGILGSAAGMRLAGRFRPVSLASIGMALFGLIDLAIFNYPRWCGAPWPVVGLFFLLGVPGAIGYAATITLFQVQVPDHVRGRAFAVIGVGQAAAGMIGAAAAGALGRSVSVIDLLTAQGAGYLLAAILMWAMATGFPTRTSA